MNYEVGIDIFFGLLGKLKSFYNFFMEHYAFFVESSGKITYESNDIHKIFITQ